MQSPIDPELVETRVIHELVDFTDKAVLEVGCGDGRLTWRYADTAQRVVAIDPDEAAIARAQATLPSHLQSTVSFRVGDITTASLPLNTFDIAVFSWSL